MKVCYVPYQPLEHYGCIGDMKTVALVSRSGAIDFFCFPRFDSPSVFAALLDNDKGGAFKITPHLPDAVPHQIYIPDTNVLVTSFTAPTGVLEITDFMPVGDVAAPSRIVRVVRAKRGTITVNMSCQPAFDYARAAHTVFLKDDHIAFFKDGSQDLCLHASVPLVEQNDAITAEFTLRQDEAAYFMLNCAAVEDPVFSADFIEVLQNETVAYWRNWISKITYQGRWRDIVYRSALTLKMLTARLYGSIVAAPTFSLPETIGGARNWDYRYSWIRDSAFTIYAFIRLGLRDEAIEFMRWVETLYQRNCKADGQLQVMYRIDGEPDVTESELTHLNGYRDSRPVRIGNHAQSQFQLDIYGELLDAMALSDQHVTKISHDAWQNAIRTANFVCDNWQQPDSGIWEQDTERHYLHSRLMCWVTVDRALHLAREESLPSEFQHWRETRTAIYNDIFANFWNDELQSFVQYQGGTVVDAALLAMPLRNFIGTHDPKWLSTLDYIGKQLASGAFVRRYLEDDNKQDRDGSFTACSFLYVSCLARAGRYDEALLNFTKLIQHANGLGLLSEEIDDYGHQVGNYPQGLSHLALINAVFALEEAGDCGRAPVK